MGYCQLVIFSLGHEEYAIDICQAKEIIRIPKITRIAGMPSFIEGFFNLRGKLIPVCDLKKRFGFDHHERGIDSRLLILELDGMTLGFTVDDVSDVLQIEEESIDNLSDEIFGINKNSIKGISILGDRIIIILNALTLKSEISKYKVEKELIVWFI